jgi:hypothetical protein
MEVINAFIIPDRFSSFFPQYLRKCVGSQTLTQRHTHVHVQATVS